MQWTETITQYLNALKPAAVNPVLAQRIYSLLDLTSLNNDDTAAAMPDFFAKANSVLGHVAAICVYPPFVSLAVTQFAETPIKIATVANFPTGAESLESVLINIEHALEDGAQEIDVVFPYARYLAGERQYAQTFVTECKAACGENVLLKVILETGALMDPVIIADASYDVIDAGADFIKTSTGKISHGATLEAAAVMLLVIKQAREKLKREIGFKASGGIRDMQTAAQYIELADLILGRDWVRPATFRIGASKLVDELLKRE